MKPVLRRAGPGVYRSTVRPIGVPHAEPFTITVQGQFRDNRAMCCWVVEDPYGEAQFLTMTEAREWVGRYFERA